MHTTWGKKGNRPSVFSNGQKNSQKTFGAVSLSGKFCYQRIKETVNHKTYITFLEDILIKKFYKKNQKIYMIQDNASYHKKPETYDFLKKNQKFIETHFIPPYLPELNAAEKLWYLTRQHATHNVFFKTQQEHIEALENIWNRMENDAEFILPQLKVFF